MTEFSKITEIDYDNKDTCTICGNYCKHRKRYFVTSSTPKGLKEVDFITAHATCRSLMKKKLELERELVDVEWKLFVLSN